MSVTLASVADALIEFILSLLRDPEAAAEFEEDPDGMLASRGLSSVSHADVCSVAPVLVERHDVIPSPKPTPAPTPEHHTPDNPVVREIKNITNQFTSIDDRDTIIDQSVNQNIWAEGDVNQLFDNEANVASGDGSMAAGDDIAIDKTQDNSTTINAGGDANVGNDTDVTDIDDSYNEATDASTTTDNSTDVALDGSANDSSTNVDVDNSLNDTSTETTDVDTTVNSDAVFDSTDTVIVDDSSADDTF